MNMLAVPEPVILHSPIIDFNQPLTIHYSHPETGSAECFKGEIRGVGFDHAGEMFVLLPSGAILPEEHIIAMFDKTH